ncbi:putative ABC transporter permease [Oscillospiraceae bacterium WX1]
MDILDLFLWFVIYSFIGWAYESVLFTIQEKHFVNRGFLNGPLCPIYGFGAILNLLIFEHTTNVFVLFFLAAVLTTTLEYLTAVVLEKVFNAKWWDYSEFPLNFQGRIGVISTVVFGIMSVVQIKYGHPFIGGLTDRLPDNFKMAFSFVILMLILFDFAFTVRHVLLLNGRLSEIQTAINAFFEKYSRRAGEFKNTLLVNFEGSEFYSDRIRTLFNLDRLQNLRLFKAFPKLQSLKYDGALRKLRDRLLGARKKP